MKKIKGILLSILVLTMIVAFNGAQKQMVVQAEGEPTGDPVKQGNVILSQDIEPYNVTPGTEFTLKIPVKAIGDYPLIVKPYINVDTTGAPLEVTSKITLSTDYMNSVTDISGVTTYLNFTMKVKDSAKIGTYKLYFSFTALNSDNSAVVTTNLVAPVIVKVTQEKSNPSIAFDNVFFKDDLAAGEEFDISLTARNQGALTAYSAYISVEGYTADGILPGYTTEKKIIGDLGSGSSKSLIIPVKVSEAATSGVKTLTIKTVFKDSEGKAYETETTNVYIPLKMKSTDGITADLVISDVTQSPSVPKAGGSVSISFNIKNKSDVDMKEIKITPTNLTATTFSPKNAEPYKYVKLIAAGETKKITMKFTVSKQVVEGLNEIDLQFSYKDQDGKVYAPTEVSKVYVLNVSNPKEESAGVPKLIISDFKTDTEDIKAGKTFVFSFDIFNTHNSLSANNIKVTLSSEENVFSVTKGSNSFYLSSVKPGETVHKEIELRVKADCVTKAYPLKIDFEYEYEGMQKLENQISTGLTISQIINLSVMENSRPTVSNIIVGTWEAPTAYTPTNMSFDFYNMGKSVLSNVTARVESTDFTPTQQTLFIGNVEAGTGGNHEMELTPNIENANGKGTLIITYEDSNGNSIEVPTEFEAFVAAPVVVDAGNMGGEMPEIPAAKKEIVKLPIFIVIQVVIFIASIVIVRKVIIGVYKAKLHKKEEELN